MTLPEVAEYLHLTEMDVGELVRSDEIPCEQSGDRVTFRCREVDAWASQRIMGLSPERLRAHHRKSSVKHHDLSQQHALIPELLKPEYVDPGLAAKTRSSVIREMVKRAVGTGLVNYPDDLLRSLDEREKMGTTALAGGVAMLHPTHHEPYLFEDSFILLARTVQPIPFGCADGRTTDLFFTLCCQDEHLHLHLLARLCMICFHTDVLERLRAAPDAAAMCAELVACEEEVIKNG